VGAQVGTWSYFIQYVQDGTHEPEKIAGYFLTGTLVAFGVGRFSSAALMRYVKPAYLMGVYSLVNIVLVAVGVAFPGWVGLWAIFVTSFFMSVMFPTIFALGIDGLNQNTKIGGSLIVMAIVGGAVLTPLMGWISQTQHSIAEAYMVPLFCYCGIALYSFVGVGMKRKVEAGGSLG
jgi:FHS family L-fucose permease-like MFS transporter